MGNALFMPMLRIAVVTSSRSPQKEELHRLATKRIAKTFAILFGTDKMGLNTLVHPAVSDVPHELSDPHKLP